VKTPDLADGDGSIVGLGVALAVAVEGAADGATGDAVSRGTTDGDAAVALQPTRATTAHAHARTVLARMPGLCADLEASSIRISSPSPEPRHGRILSWLARMLRSDFTFHQTGVHS
jgi:hypothetical protein